MQGQGQSNFKSTKHTQYQSNKGKSKYKNHSESDDDQYYYQPADNNTSMEACNDI